MKILLSKKHISDLTILFNEPKRYFDFRKTLDAYKYSNTSYEHLASIENAVFKSKVIKSFQVNPEQGIPITLYASKTKEEYPPYVIAKALHPEGYLCNFSSIYYHALTNQVPSLIYVAIEGARENDRIEHVKKRQLLDFNIQSAFMKPHRLSREIYKFLDYKIAINRRVHRNQIGVQAIDKDFSTDFNFNYKITCLERALIDAVINPQYNGGITSVLEYFKKASKKINVDIFLNIYKNIYLIYPYWQTIGFIAERTGLNKLALSLSKSYKIKNKFYIDHLAKTNWLFDTKWQVYFPKGLFDER